MPAIYHNGVRYGGVNGEDGFSPTISENKDNTNDIYKLDITDKNGSFTTPNLKGGGSSGDLTNYYSKTEVDNLIEPLNKSKHTHNNKEVLDKLSTDDENTKLLFNGQEIKSGVEIDDTSTTATDKTWSVKKINDTVEQFSPTWTGTKAEWESFDKSTLADGAIVNITDDYEDNSIIDDSSVANDTTWSSTKIKSTIPTTLPANGGNADTLESKSASDFAQNISAWNSGDIKDLLLSAKSGFVFINSTVTGMPTDGGYWFGQINASSVHRLLTATSVGANVRYDISYNNGTQAWSEWINHADGGDASTFNGHPIEAFATSSSLDTLSKRISALEEKLAEKE